MSSLPSGTNFILKVLLQVKQKPAGEPDCCRQPSVWWWKEREKEVRQCMGCGKRKNWRWQWGRSWCKWSTLHSEPMVISRSILLPRALSAIKVLLQPGSVLVSVAHFVNEGDVDAHGLGCCLKPYWCPWVILSPGVILIWVDCAVTWGHGNSQINAAMEGHVWVQGLTSSGVSWLMSIAHVTTEILADVSCLDCHLNLCWCP